jgi:hypothetical protein
MKVEVKITDDAGNIRQYVVSGSLHLADFIEEIEYMQRLYSNARYAQAEATRDKLAEQLDDLMRLGSNDR